ncbi:uncharacterized protein LOC128734198 [Sabethes cyaneus]|uniref:uncharacterized protein LOC128734198 n=1 Tax=Sabethes cyaneus TaxID=53552 RepID=UPI00237E9027|nr:uncharacterized protein LOC128734198 [Sabethes cyaneus]
MRTNSEVRESSVSSGRCESSDIFEQGSSSAFNEATASGSVVEPPRAIKIDTMAEAQRLIGISLAKIAQSRVCRGGVSLHKNLLVATVLQKARYIFMEEAYHIVHGHYLQQNKCMELEMEKQRNAAAAAAAAAASVNNVDDESCSESEDSDESESYASSENNDESDSDDKENSPPSPSADDESSMLYFDLDVKKVEKSSVENSNKRRRDATEWETDEAVQSILPKRIKSESAGESTVEEVSNNESASTSECLNHQVEAEDLSRQGDTTLQHTPSVESIDRITSLVSIFSFGNLSRSVSTPDFCAAQAKDSESSLTQLQHTQRGYLTMTV